MKAGQAKLLCNSTVDTLFLNRFSPSTVFQYIQLLARKYCKLEVSPQDGDIKRHQHESLRTWKTYSVNISRITFAQGMKPFVNFKGLGMNQNKCLGEKTFCFKILSKY